MEPNQAGWEPSTDLERLGNFWSAAGPGDLQRPAELVRKSCSLATGPAAPTAHGARQGAVAGVVAFASWLASKQRDAKNGRLRMADLKELMPTYQL